MDPSKLVMKSAVAQWFFNPCGDLRQYGTSKEEILYLQKLETIFLACGTPNLYHAHYIYELEQRLENMKQRLEEIEYRLRIE